MFVGFLMSCTKDQLRKMSTTPFEHFCGVLDGKEEAFGFKTFDEMWELHRSKTGIFCDINCMNLSHYSKNYCMACNYSNKKIYIMCLLSI